MAARKVAENFRRQSRSLQSILQSSWLPRRKRASICTPCLALLPQHSRHLQSWPFRFKAESGWGSRDRQHSFHPPHSLPPGRFKVQHRDPHLPLFLQAKSRDTAALNSYPFPIIYSHSPCPLPRFLPPCILGNGVFSSSGFVRCLVRDPRVYSAKWPEQFEFVPHGALLP